nr:MAG TPA: Pulmonary surfactant-associated protein D, c-type lectin, alpha-helical coiled [Caudoviricetes sp.]
MSAIVRVRDNKGVVHDIPAIVGPKGDTGATGPQGAPGSDASVTAENIQAALGYTPGEALTSEGSTGQIENLFPDKLTVILNEFWRFGNVCQFVLQFSISETMEVDYGANIAKLPFTSAMRCWLNNATQFYVDRDTSYIRLNDTTLRSGSYILSGMYITEQKATLNEMEV